MEALQTSNATLVRPAGVAAQVRPRPVRNGVFGLAVGLILGIALAFLAEAIDTRIRSANEIGDRLGLPLLARLSEPPRRYRSKDRLVMLGDANSARGEAFRLLRTNIEFANLDRAARSIMITSAVQQEGKSTTIANLAVAEARAGRRVILVDLDLRRPWIHRFFDLQGPGLTDVVLGHATLEEALVPVPLLEAERKPRHNGQGNGRVNLGGSLGVLAAGHVPPDPGEFVGSNRLSELLRQVRERADLVYIDAPPLLHVGDALTLSSKVDGMIVAVRISIARRPLLNELARVLERVPAAKLGFVLTDAKQEEGYGYGDYSYYYEAAARGREKEPAR
jgi:Mrp family chromosome partitioning ATPase